MLGDFKMKCGFCNRDLTERQQQRKSTFCSRSCGNKYRYRNVKKEFVCQRCGKNYIKKGTGKSGKKYCSHKCGQQHNLGKKFSKEHREKIAKAQEGLRVEGDFDCDRCSRRFKSNTSLRAHKAHCGHQKILYRCYNCDKKYKGLAGLQRHQIWCIGNDGNEKLREKIREATRVANFRRLKDENLSIICKGTRPEVELEKELLNNKIDFIKQFDGVEGVRHCYDFLIGDKIIVEVDGDYWHGNKDKFELSNRQKRQYHIDVRYTVQAQQGGFIILRYWESDILKDVTSIVEDIIGVTIGKDAKLMRVL
jgi:very-short-patch-repair endonuclease